MSALLVIISLSFLVLAHEAGHFAAAKYFKLKVDEFGLGFPPRLWGKKKGGTIYSINLLPFGGFVKIKGEQGEFLGGKDADEAPSGSGERLFSAQSAWRKSVIVLAGVFVNFLIGWALLSAILAVGTPRILAVSGVEPGSPAEAAGLKEGSIIQGFSRADEFIDYVNRHRGEKITVSLREGKGVREVVATPRQAPGEGKGALGVYLVEGGEDSLGILAGIREGLARTVQIFGMTIAGFGNLLMSLFRGELLAGVIGPVGIFTVARETTAVGALYLFQLLAVISINLAALNLIPFPALDGGRFALILIETIKGSPLPKRAEAVVNGIGLVFLLTLVLLLTIRDVSAL